MSRRGSASAVLGVLLPGVLLLGVLLLVGCTGPAAEPTADPDPAPAAPVAPSGDGVLRVGTDLPATGADAASGPAQVAGVEVAVREINEAGGVLGAPVVVYHRDSGDASSDRGELSAADLTTRSVDVIIGPQDPALAARIAAASATPVIASAATGDGELLFGVTAPPTSAITAVARAITGAGGSDIALLAAPDDPSTEALLATALEAAGGRLAAVQPATAAGVEKLGEADAVVLAAAPTTVLLEALVASDLGGDRLWILGQPDVSAVRPGPLEGAATLVPTTGDVVAARLRSADPVVTDPGLGAQAYDATIIAALAAVAAGDDGGPSIASRVADVTAGGIRCRSFAECLNVLSTESDIDYDGVSGPLDLDATGTPTRGSWALQRFDVAGLPQPTGEVVG